MLQTSASLMPTVLPSEGSSNDRFNVVQAAQGPRGQHCTAGCCHLLLTGHALDGSEPTHKSLQPSKSQSWQPLHCTAACRQPAWPCSAQAIYCCGLVQGMWSPHRHDGAFAACRHSFNAAWAPLGNEAALPEPEVTDPCPLFDGVDDKTITTEGAAVTAAGLQPEVHTCEERDKLLARFLKKSLTRLAALGSSEKPIRQTYTHFVQQTTALVAAFTQQLAHFEAVQRHTRFALADILLESQAMLNDVGDIERDISAGF